MPSRPPFDLADEVLRLLTEADRPLWASEIAERVSDVAGFRVERRDVNRCLYGAKLRGKVRQQSGSKWVVIRTSASGPRVASRPAQNPESPGGGRASSKKRAQVSARKPPWDRFSRFVSYYLDCVREDESEGAERFLSDAGKRFIPFPLPDEWSLSETEVVELPIKDVPREFLTELRKLGASGALYYGYPLAVRWVERSARGWTGGFALPVFLHTVQYELDGSVLALRRADEPPRPNPRFLQSVASTVEERRALLDELGLTGDEDDTLENGLADLAVRLVQSQPGIDVVEQIDPTELGREPGLATLTAGGLYNRAVLVLGERSKYTHGLEAELERLHDTVPDPEFAKTALSLLFADDHDGQAPSAAASHGPTIAEVVPLNDEQREAVRAGMTQPMTVVTGPPGTGKSQVVLTLLANAYLRGESVLFSSRNNKAVNVVEQRLNAIAGIPLVVRAGTQAGDRNLRAELVGFLTRLLALSVETAVQGRTNGVGRGARGEGCGLGASRGSPEAAQRGGQAGPGDGAGECGP